MRLVCFSNEAKIQSGGTLPSARENENHEKSGKPLSSSAASFPPGRTATDRLPSSGARDLRTSRWTTQRFEHVVGCVRRIQTAAGNSVKERRGNVITEWSEGYQCWRREARISVLLVQARILRFVVQRQAIRAAPHRTTRKRSSMPRARQFTLGA